MANTAAAKKAMRQDAKRRAINDIKRRKYRELVKAAVEAIESGAKDAQTFVHAAYKAIDKAAKAGILKKNTAARKKSSLQRKLNNVQAGSKKAA